MLIPTVRRTWAPRGQTPVLRHSAKRERVSAISALTVSPQRQRLALYLRFHDTNITAQEVVAFLRQLLRHLRGPVVLLWDSGTIHKGEEVCHFLQTHRRLQVERFPGYAPELNPDEFVWTQAKRALANSAPADLAALKRLLRHATQRLQRSQDLLWSCIHASDLPWSG